MKKIILLTLIFTAFISCKQNNTATEPKVEKETQKEEEIVVDRSKDFPKILLKFLKLMEEFKHSIK